MKKNIQILSFFALLAFATLVANAQERVDPDPNYSEYIKQEAINAKDEAKRIKENEYMKLEKPFATLSDATGWTRCSSEPVWVKRKNAIYQLDNFVKLELGRTVYDRVDFLYFNKIFLYNDGKSKASYFCTFNSNEYIEQVKKITDGDNEIVLHIYRYKRSWSPQTKLYRGGEESDYWKKLVIKFQIDKAKNTARFFYYISWHDKSVLLDEICQPQEQGFHHKLDLDLDMQSAPSTSSMTSIIQSDALYENFYYETSADKFLKFINAPLVQNKK